MSDVILEAIHSGVLKLGDSEIPCYVLNNESRVLAQRNVVNLISGGRDSGDLGRYLRAKNIQSLLPDKLKGDFQKKVITFRVNGKISYGLIGSDVIDLLDTYLKARENGILHPSQAKIAEFAEIFIRATAKTGIDAVIDEATGYEYFKKAEDLQARLQASTTMEKFKENLRIAFPNARIQRRKRIKESKRKKRKEAGQMEMEFKYL